MNDNVQPANERTPANELLGADEPAAFAIQGEGAPSPFIIVVDHAGQRIPQSLGQLGLSDSDCERHIAWDIGAGALASLIAARLDALLIRQTYSRLVIDCNRTPGTPTSIPERSESTPIPGNVGLTEQQRTSRHRAVFQPYHERIGGLLDRRREAGLASILLSVHTFTPVYAGVSRPWHVGVLYNRDRTFASILLRHLRAEPGLVVGDNEPYSVSDESDYTIPVHGEQRGIPHVAVEVRQDLVAGSAGQERFAALLVRLLPLVRERHAP